MNELYRRILPWPPTAIVISLLASALLLYSWFAQPLPHLNLDTLQHIILAGLLCAAIVFSGLYPIHLRHNLKVIVTTIPLYVAVTMLPPGLAALIAGIGLVLIDLLNRSQTGNTPSDIAIAAGRWIITAWLCAWVFQQMSAALVPLPLVLLSTALLMFLCDVLTATIEIGAMSAERPWRILRLLITEGSLTEAVQYSLGILATIATLEQPWSLILWIAPICIVYLSFRHAKEMHDGTGKLLESLADAVDLRDPYTGGHSRRVTEFSIQIMQEMGMLGPEVELIRSAARVHDIGKIGIPDQILNKAGRLTDDEKAIMDTHPDRGAELLARYKDFARGMEIVRHHHEHWNGSGYPAGLQGLDIPLGARIVAVADSFDAMTSNRPYRAGMPIQQAAQILQEGRGKQWDPLVVNAFLRTLTEQLEQSPEIADHRAETPAQRQEVMSA